MAGEVSVPGKHAADRRLIWGVRDEPDHRATADRYQPDCRGAYVLAALRQPKVIGLLLASVVLFFLAGSLFSAATGRKNQDSANA